MLINAATVHFTADMDVSKYNAAVDTLIQKQNQLNQATGRASQAQQNLQNQLNKTEMGLKETFLRWAMIEHSVLNAYAAFKTASMVLIGLTKNIAESGMAFNSMLAMVDTVAKYTPAAMGRVRKSILDMARESPRSAEEFAKGLYSIVSAMGATGREMEILAQAHKDAVAGFSDLDTAAKALSVTMNVYGDQITDVSEISDVMFAMVDKAIAPYSELAGVLGLVLNQAKAAGQSFGTAAGALAFLNKVGISTSRSATYLNQVFRQLTKRAPELKKVFGIDVQDATGNYRDFVDIMEELNQKLSKFAPVAQTTALRQVFKDSRELMGIQSIMANFELFREVVEDVRGSIGGAQKAFERATDFPGYKLQVFINQWKTLKTEISTGVIATLERWITVSRPAYQWLLNLTSGGKQTAGAWLTVATAITTTLAAITGFMWGIVKFRATVAILTKVLAPAEAAALGFARWAKVATLATNPWTWAITAAVVALGLLAIKIRDKKREEQQAVRAAAEHAAAMKDEVLKAQDLIHRHLELSKKTELTKNEKIQLQRISKQLVELLPGLNWQLSEEGRITFKTADAVKALKDQTSQYIEVERIRLQLQRTAISQHAQGLLGIRQQMGEFANRMNRAQMAGNLPLPPAMLMPDVEGGNVLPTTPGAAGAMPVSRKEALKFIQERIKDLQDNFSGLKESGSSAAATISRAFDTAVMAFQDASRKIKAGPEIVSAKNFLVAQKAMDLYQKTIDQVGKETDKILKETTPEAVAKQLADAQKKLDESRKQAAQGTQTTVDAEDQAAKKADEQLKILRDRLEEIQALHAKGAGVWKENWKAIAALAILNKQANDPTKIGLALEKKKVETLQLQVDILNRLKDQQEENNNLITQGAIQSSQKWQDMVNLGLMSQEELVSRLATSMENLGKFAEKGTLPEGMKIEEIYSSLNALFNVLQKAEEELVKIELQPGFWSDVLENMTLKPEFVRSNIAHLEFLSKAVDQVRDKWGDTLDALAGKKAEGKPLTVRETSQYRIGEAMLKGADELAKKFAKKKEDLLEIEKKSRKEERKIGDDTAEQWRELLKKREEQNNEYAKGEQEKTLQRWQNQAEFAVRMNKMQDDQEAKEKARVESLLQTSLGVFEEEDARRKEYGQSVGSMLQAMTKRYSGYYESIDKIGKDYEESEKKRLNSLAETVFGVLEEETGKQKKYGEDVWNILTKIGNKWWETQQASEDAIRAMAALDRLSFMEKFDKAGIAPIKRITTLRQLLKTQEFENYWRGYSEVSQNQLALIEQRQTELLARIGPVTGAINKYTAGKIKGLKPPIIGEFIDEYANLEEQKTEILRREEENRYDFLRKKLEDYQDWAYGMWSNFWGNIFTGRIGEGFQGLAQQITEAMIKTSPIYKQIMEKLVLNTETIVPPEEAMKLAMVDAGQVAGATVARNFVQAGQQVANMIGSAVQQQTTATVQQLQMYGVAGGGAAAARIGGLTPEPPGTAPGTTQTTNQSPATSSNKNARSRVNWYNAAAAAANIYTSAQAGMTPLEGALSGAATGFMIGGPVGAAIGELIGLFGSKKKSQKKKKWDELLSQYYQTPQIPFSSPQFLPFGALAGGMSPEMAFHGGFSPTGGHSAFFGAQRGVVVNNVQYFDFSGSKEQLNPTDWRRATRSISQQRSRDSLRPNSTDYANSSRRYEAAIT